MSRAYDTDALIAAVKRRGMVPTNQATFTEDQIIAAADDEMVDTLVPIVFGLKADHFRTHTDYTTTEELEYAIPAVALHRNLINVTYVTDAGIETSLDKIDFDGEIASGSRPDYPDGAYYVHDDSVFLYPVSVAGKTLRLHYYQLPNQLVATSAAAHVTSVDYDTGVVTCDSVPADWTTSTSLCAVAGEPGFRLRFGAQTPSDVSSPTVTFDDASEIVAGDWIAAEGDSPIPQLPAEAFPVLARATVAHLLGSLGDPSAKDAEVRLEKAIVAYRNVAAPRVEKAPELIINRNRLVHFLD